MNAFIKPFGGATMKCANKNLHKIPFGKKVLGANKSKDEKRSEAAVRRCFTK